MKKLRKGQKKLIIIGAIILATIVAIFIIKGIVNHLPEKATEENTPQIIALPDTTYSNMQVKNVEMEYLKDNNETMVSMEIHNTTSNDVTDEDLDAILVGPNENVLGQIQTYIQKLAPGEQYDISVILKGDLTATTQIKLVKK